MRLLVTVLVVVWMAPPAQAQWAATPYLGGNVAGDAEFRRGGPGASLGHLGGRLGFELDLQRYHHFFKDSEIFPFDPAAPPNCTPAVSSGRPCTDINTDALGFMGNVVVPVRASGASKWRPYATAGVGVIRAWTNEEHRNQDNFAFNVGGGVMYALSARVGLRSDLRTFRALVDETKADGVYLKDYGFWRISVGMTFGFARK